MNRWYLPGLRCCFFLLLAIASPAFAENDGLADLDRATQLKATAETLDDLNDVIDHLESALEKGLDHDNTELAKQLLVGSLLQRGSRFAAELTNLAPNDPQSSMRAMQLRQFALSDLQRAVELDPRVWEAHLLIGNILLQPLPISDPRAARRSLNRVIDAPDASAEQKARALALRSATQRDGEQQLNDLNRAIELQPEKPDYLRLRAQYYYGKEKFNEALADADKAIALEADHAMTHELRGMILLGLEKYDEALASFNRATELVPEAALPYQHRGELYRQKGDLEKAVEQLSKALELSPDNVAVLLLRAGVYYELKQNDKALEDIEHAIRIRPDLVQPHLMRVEIYAVMNRMNEAIVQLEKLVKLAPKNAQLVNRLASFYMIAGRPRKAIETLAPLLEQNSEDFTALRLRADAYLNIGLHREAIADFERAIALKEDDESLLNNFAWVLATSPEDELRDGERALKLASKAAELSGHQKPHILSTLGAAYAETGDFENAKKWSQMAVELAQKAVETADNEAERKRLQDELEQLKKELESYGRGEPVRERQTAAESEDKPAGDSAKPTQAAPQSEKKPASSQALSP